MASKVKTVISHQIVKPAVAGISAALLDHFFMKNADLKSCAMFGGAVAAGIVAVSPVEALVTAYSPTHTLIGKLGKGVEHRVMEITCGSAAAYALNRFVIKNEYTNRDLLYKLAIVAVADIVGETLCEVMMLH